MSVQLSDLNKFAADLKASGFPQVNSEHLLLLINDIPFERLTMMHAAADAGDPRAKEKLENYISFARAHTMLQTRYHLNIPLQKIAALFNDDPDHYRKIMNDLAAGVTTGIESLRPLAINKTPEQRYATPVSVASTDERAPIHATKVPPPSNVPAPAAQAKAAPTPAPAPAPQANQVPFEDMDFSETHPSQTFDKPTNVANFPNRQKEERNFDNVHVYGGKTALAFDHSPTPDRKSTTINISLAKAKGERCTGGVDWSSKIMIMLTSKEVALIAAVVMGQMQSVRFAGHGSNNEKWIEVTESQDPGYLGTIKVTMAQGKDIRNCSITFNDILEVLAIFNRAMISQHVGATAMTVPQMTQRVSTLYQKAMSNKSRPPQRPAA